MSNNEVNKWVVGENYCWCQPYSKKVSLLFEALDQENLLLERYTYSQLPVTYNRVWMTLAEVVEPDIESGTLRFVDKCAADCKWIFKTK